MQEHLWNGVVFFTVLGRSSYQKLEMKPKNGTTQEPLGIPKTCLGFRV